MGQAFGSLLILLKDVLIFRQRTKATANQIHNKLHPDTEQFLTELSSPLRSSTLSHEAPRTLSTPPPQFAKTSKNEQMSSVIRSGSLNLHAHLNVNLRVAQSVSVYGFSLKLFFTLQYYMVNGGRWRKADIALEESTLARAIEKKA